MPEKYYVTEEYLKTKKKKPISPSKAVCNKNGSKKFLKSSSVIRPLWLEDSATSLLSMVGKTIFKSKQGNMTNG